MRYPMLLKYQNIITFKRPYVVENSFSNYRILSTQDFILQSKQQLVKSRAIKPESYKAFEKKYLYEMYGFETKRFNDFYYKTRESKF